MKLQRHLQVIYSETVPSRSVKQLKDIFCYCHLNIHKYFNLTLQCVSLGSPSAISTFNPAVFVLNELLKQQLAMTRRFIESNRHLHSSLVQSLEPPNYRYTTLEDTKKVKYTHALAVNNTYLQLFDSVMEITDI